MRQLLPQRRICFELSRKRSSVHAAEVFTTGASGAAHWYQDPDAHRSASAKKLTIAGDADEVVRGHLAKLVSPFAYKLTREFGRRAPNLLPPGYYAILTRRILPIEAHEAYAIRVEGRVELGFVHWDGQRLLLLPHTDPADLVVLRAKSDEEVLSHMVGKVAVVVHPEIVKTA